MQLSNIERINKLNNHLSQHPEIYNALNLIKPSALSLAMIMPRTLMLDPTGSISFLFILCPNTLSRYLFFYLAFNFFRIYGSLSAFLNKFLCHFHTRQNF